MCSEINVPRNELIFLPLILRINTSNLCVIPIHTCEPVASKMLEKFAGELAKKRENFVGLRYVKNVGK